MKNSSASIDISSIRNNGQEKKKEEKKSVFDFLNKDIKLFSKSFGDKKKERFYSELTILLTAGVDIKTALELIEEEQTKAADKDLFKKIKETVINGSTLSEAVYQSGILSLYEYHSLQIGEESGKLSDVLHELNSFFAKKIQQKRQLINALSYPVLVLITAFGAIFFMMKFVVPMFADVFKRFHGELPALTKLIIHISDGFARYSYYFLLLLLSCGILIYQQRKKQWFRKYTSMWLLRVPVLGDMIQKVYLARFCHAMNLLVSAKTPLLNAIELVKKMIGFYPMEHSLDTVQKDILKGVSLHAGLAKFSIYNRRMISLIKVAEEVNQLDVIFEKLAKQYGDEVEHQTSIIGNLIEPILIIFLGLMVAVILIAMYLPLFQLSTSVH